MKSNYKTPPVIIILLQVALYENIVHQQKNLYSICHEVKLIVIFFVRVFFHEQLWFT